MDLDTRCVRRDEHLRERVVDLAVPVIGID